MIVFLYEKVKPYTDEWPRCCIHGMIMDLSLSTSRSLSLTVLETYTGVVWRVKFLLRSVKFGQDSLG